MLQVARDLVSDHHLDVVVGVVEDHKRSETAKMVLGLELLRRRKIEYRGRTLEEFDLDAALRRKPQLLLLDELAHTNVEGSRHPKRWQDVEELLSAGIDVFSTMNVQHVESLNDVVAQITHVQVRETVPDSVIDKADAVELVDIAPEELLARLKEGKVYLPDQAQRAAQHFFQRGNLLALRELALRRTAQHVDEDVREYREENGVASTWPAGERILVCVGPSPSSARLIRSAARMAAGLRCSWVAAYVEATTSRPMSEPDRERLEAHLRVAEALGATVTRFTGISVAEALLHYARKHNVTRLIIGKPTHSRLWDRVRGSLLDEVVRGSGDIDVHVIRGDAAIEGAPRGASPQTRTPAWRYGAAALLVGLTLAVSAMLRGLFNLPDLEMLFLLAVMVSAVWFGRGPSLLAAGLGVAFYDFFFVPPFHTFSVDDRRYFLTFAMMFGVGIVMSELAGRLRYQERDALSREERTAALYALTRELASTDDPHRIAEVASRHAAILFSANVVVVAPGADGELRPIGASPLGATLDAKDIGVAKWSFEHDALAGFGTETLPGASALCAPLRAREVPLGVLALIVENRQRELTLEQRAQLDVFCRQVAVALERARLAKEAEQASLRAKTEEMRSSLLSAVSHDLRTPLASITGAATSLRDDDALSAGTRDELVDSIVDQAERLERLVANLLDMTRLESGAIALRRDWVPLEEMIGSALTRLEKKLGERSVRVSIARDVPLLSVDPVLFEQVFVNLFENAEKYTPSDSPIEIVAKRDGDRVEIEVMDRGAGLAAGSEDRVFEKFFRGANVGGVGAGLGLSICKGIVEAHGGTLRAANRVGGGAVFYISIPTGGEAPEVGASVDA